MRWRWMLMLTLVATAALAWSMAKSSARELSYEGKPLDQWLDAGYEDASRVLYEIGPEAAGCIFTKLKREHPQYGRWGRYRSFWKRLPAPCQKLLPRPRESGFDEWRACHALLAIGPRVVPVLGKSLKDDHFLIRAVSAQTLGLFHQQGISIRASLPALEAALQDRDAGVRQQAAAVLARSARGLQSAAVLRP
jgi:HEAT repeats